MAANYEERTEAPTPRRRTEARERGQVARSGDLTSAAVLLGAMIALRLFGAPLLATLLALLHAALASPADAATYVQELPRVWARLLATLGAAALPVMLPTMV